MVLRSGGTVCIREIINARLFSGTKPEAVSSHAIPGHKLKVNAEMDFKRTD